MRTFAAVDLGAQTGRVALGRFDGDRLAVEEVHRFPNAPRRIGPRLVWDFERLYADVLEGLGRAARNAELASIAVDSWAVDFGIVDPAGRLVADPVHYRDERRAGTMPEVLARVPAHELYERTGIQLLPINTIFELAAMANAHDPAFVDGNTLLLVPDLFHQRLCGSRTTERTNASTTQCVDIESGSWATDLLARLDVPAGLLPEIVNPATTLGEVLPELGLGRATVVAGATHDTAAAVAGVPLRDDRCAYLSVGTWSLVGVESTVPVLGDEAFDANVTNEAGVQGTVRVLANVTGLWLLDECVRAWGGDRSYAELVALARAAPPLRSLVDPNDPAFAAPGDMPARIAEYCSSTGQEEPADDGAIARCIFESLALKQAEAVDRLAQVTGRELETLHVVGGGANNELLCAWTAAASGRRVLAGPTESTLVGNLLVQALALGELSSLDQGRELVADSFPQTEYEPHTTQPWLEARERFAALCEQRQTLEVGR